MPQKNIASFNIGAIRFPLTDPRMVGFASNLERINRLGDRAPGFIWRRPQTNDGDFCQRNFGNRQVLLNLTVWATVEDLGRFVWKTVHKQFYEQRKEWFTQSDEQNFVMWWIPAGHIPSIEEAVEKLFQLRTRGESEECFSWQRVATTADLGTASKRSHHDRRQAASEA